MSNLTIEEIRKFDDPEILEAVSIPKVPKMAYRIFMFLIENQNLVTVAGGMNHYITGFDRSKLCSVSSMYGIDDLSRYNFAISIFEDNMLKLQNNNLEK